MINKTVQKIELSGIRKMFEMAGEGAINLGLGQPDMNPPKDIIDAYHRAMLDGNNGYGSTYGLIELREEIAKQYSKYKNSIEKENVLVTVGATQAFMIVMKSLLEEGQEVLYPEPGFVLYGPQIELGGGVPVPYPLRQEHGFVPQIHDLERLRTERTKAVIFNSPGNPTGGVFSKKDVESLIDWAAENDIIIISDEVYEKMIYEGKHHSFLGDYENVVMINSFSKTFAVTGWRIGFLITRDDWLKEIGKVNYYTVACPPTPTQHAVLYGIKNRLDFIEDMNEKFKERRDVIVKRLNDMPGMDCLKPKGAFYVFPSFDYELSSNDLAMKLLENNVLATPGSAFGPTGEGHMRFSYSNSIDNIERAMDIMDPIIESMEG